MLTLMPLFTEDLERELILITWTPSPTTWDKSRAENCQECWSWYSRLKVSLHSSHVYCSLSVQIRKLIGMSSLFEEAWVYLLIGFNTTKGLCKYLAICVTVALGFTQWLLQLWDYFSEFKSKLSKWWRMTKLVNRTLSHLTVLTSRNKIVSAMLSFVVSYYVTWQKPRNGMCLWVLGNDDCISINK